MITGMTKREQVQAVAALAKITNQDARRALDAVGALIATGLLEDGRFVFSGLGSFVVQQRRPRRVMNPSTGVMMDLPASAAVKFKPEPQVRLRIKERHT
jgi:DNA-binding protein HU-beta